MSISIVLDAILFSMAKKTKGHLLTSVADSANTWPSSLASRAGVQPGKLLYYSGVAVGAGESS